MKICTKCIILKLLTEFPLASRMRLGRGSWCRTCINEYKRQDYKNNKARESAKNKLWRQNNLEYARKRQKNWRDKNPDYIKGKLLQKYWPESTWREALQKFNVLVVLQNNLCAICNKIETASSKKGCNKIIRDLCVDHCHVTKKVRGLLCDNCNVLIGRAKDSPSICESAALYLRSTNDALSRSN